ncbi:MAG: aldolase/citrate lyase family protein [Acidobacteria bacterium]|nr:aldolase/citrate lyase family protein [Acidobacteriota bacterium]
MRSSAKRGATCSFLAVLMITIPAAAQQQGQGTPRAKLYNTAKQKLLEGKQIFSFTQSRMDVAGYCESAKHYDYAWIEMQHSTLDFADVEKMLGACPNAAAIPFIRVPDAQEWHIQHATDVGALGIIVPTVDDADRAREAAKWVRYPPIGRRSSGQGFFSTLWNVHGINYRQTVDENMLLVVMIETPTGVANAYDIASVPGVDVVIVGNNDLAQFSGFAATDERYQQLITKIHDDTLKAGKIFGQANAAFATGHPLSKDAKFFQNGPSNDGWQPPARAGRGSGAQGGGQAPPPR